ncbi:MAG: hypothetical protein ACHQT7_00620 [Candidatus Levyibacteriota bacterium]
MSKKRKTKKEKMRTAVRLAHIQPLSTLQTSPVYTIDAQRPAQTVIAPTISLSQTHYGYVGRDMKKTFLITSVLLGLTLIFHSLLQNNVLHLSFFGY